MIDIAEIKEYLIIDKNRLDREITQHPELLFRVCEAYIEAAAERDARKEMLAMVDAELDAEIREELKDEKVTEAMVKNRIQVHQKHVDAWSSFVEAKQQADVLNALKESFVARGYMLRDLAQLHIANYWENNSVTGTDPIYRRQRQRLATAREQG